MHFFFFLFLLIFTFEKILRALCGPCEGKKDTKSNLLKKKTNKRTQMKSKTESVRISKR